MSSLYLGLFIYINVCLICVCVYVCICALRAIDFTLLCLAEHNLSSLVAGLCLRERDWPIAV